MVFIGNWKNYMFRPIAAIIRFWQLSCCKSYTGLFINPSGISDLDCATTKTDTAERSISIARESLQVFFCTRGLCHVIHHNCDKGSWRQSLLSTAKCCNACRRNLITGLTSAAPPRVHISSSCKVGQKLGEILYLLICSFLPYLSWLLRSRVPKSRRDLQTTLYTTAITDVYYTS